MNEAALRVVAGEITRQLVNTPPQVGKTEFWSRWFPAWYLGNYPDRRVILGSYNAEHAAEQGEKARDILEEFGEEFFGVSVRKDHRAKDNWAIDGRIGGMRTMGMDGGITGKPADLVIIDDPIKGWPQASSPTERNKVWKIYVSSIVSRLQPGSAICLIYTPWHPDDLGGRLLEKEWARWSKLRMPALAEEPIPEEVRATRTGYNAMIGAPDPLGRPPGRAIWPNRFDEEHYAGVRALDRDEFDALYQCSPHHPEGGLFKRASLEGKAGAALPFDAEYVRGWDTAASHNKGDWTVGVLVARKGLSYYVVDVDRFRLEPGEREERMLATLRADNAMYPHKIKTVIELAPSSGGKTEGLSFIQKFAGYDVEMVRPEGNKEARARTFAAQVNGGNVRICSGSWAEEYMDELFAFPAGGKHDDQVDASSLAFSKLALGAEPGGYATMSTEEYLQNEEAYT